MEQDCMTTIARRALGLALMAAALLGALAARQLGIVPVGGAASGLDALLLLAGICCGGAAAITLLLRGPAPER